MLKVSPNCNIEFGKRIAGSERQQHIKPASNNQQDLKSKRNSAQAANFPSKYATNISTPTTTTTLGEYSQGGKLKNSTISRVPSAKSRLRQPVATSCLSSSSLSSPSGSKAAIPPVITTIATISGELNSSKQTDQEAEEDKLQHLQNVSANCRLNQRPSSTTKQTLRSNQAAANQVKSSTTTTNQRSRNPTPKIAKTCTSILPRLTTTRRLADSTTREDDNQAADSNGITTTANNSGRCIPAPRPELAKRTTTVTSATGYCLNNAKKKASTGNQAQQQAALVNGTQVASGRQLNAPTNSSGDALAQLGGRLTNLVAVVRPQQSQQLKSTRTNSSAKPSLGKQLLASPKITTTTTTPTTAKLNRIAANKRGTLLGTNAGKANLNHKDVNSQTTAEDATKEPNDPSPEVHGVPQEAANVELNKVRSEVELKDEEALRRESKQDEHEIVSSHVREMPQLQQQTSGTAPASPTVSSRELRPNLKTLVQAACCSESGASESLNWALACPKETTKTRPANDKNGPFDNDKVVAIQFKQFATRSSSSNEDDNVHNAVDGSVDSHGDAQKQHGNDKQKEKTTVADKWLPSHTITSRLLIKGQHEPHSQEQHNRLKQPTTGTTTTLGQEQQQRRRPCSSERPTAAASNCYNHHGANLNSTTKTSAAINVSSTSVATTTAIPPEVATPTTTSATRIDNLNSSGTKAAKASRRNIFNGRQNSSNGGPINDRMLAKPMGQQVLSLMMLDAGLLPAGPSGDPAQKEEDSCESTSQTNHVSLQSEPQTLVASSCLSRSDATLPLIAARKDCNHDDDDDDDDNSNGLGYTFRELSLCPSPAVASRSLAAVNQNVESYTHYMDRRRQYNARKHEHNPDPLLFDRSNPIKLNTTDVANEDQCPMTSTSLPGSPRLRRLRGRTTDWRGDNSRAFTTVGSTNCSNQLNENSISANSSGRRLLDEGLRRATARWLSPVRINERLVQSINRQQQVNLLSSCDNQDDSYSLSSSSCSSLNNHHCPPLALSLSNHLNSLRFHELIKANSLELKRNAQQQQQQHPESNQAQQTSQRKQKQDLGICNNDNIDQLRVKLDMEMLHPANQIAQVSKQHELLLTGDPIRGKTSEIDHDDQGSHSPMAIGFNESEQQHQHEANNHHRGNRHIKQNGSSADGCLSHQQEKRLDASENIQKHQLRLVQNMDNPILRRQQQQRSNSIGGQEFHSNGNYYRLKHSLYNGQPHSPYDVDQRGQQQQQAHSYYGGQSPALLSRSIQHPNGGSYLTQHFVGRSHSPNEQLSPFEQIKRDMSIKYPMDNKPHLPRNHLHASLECLNLTYSDQEQQQHHHHHQQQQQFLRQQPQQFHHNQQHHLLANQHYAASYVLSTPPPNTIINQSGDQDLAAAAMGACPPSQQQQHYQHQTVTNNQQQQLQQQQSGYSSQSLLNRTIAQVSQQSPLRRIGLGSTPSGATAGNILSQLTGGSHHTPIRAGHSSLSLASSSYPIEDKLQNEIKMLQSELKTEKEKNEALNSQLNINSGLMAAFEQSLTTLNTRLRQMTALSEQKDKELDELRDQMKRKTTTNNEVDCSEKSTSPIGDFNQLVVDNKAYIERDRCSPLNCSEDPSDNKSELNLMKIIDDLRRQLIEKDRLLTDTRLEALSAAHQLEQLESRLNGEHSLLANENDIDEGVMMANHSPSDSDAITDSAHFSEMNSQISKSNGHQHHRSHDTNQTDENTHDNGDDHSDMILFGQTNNMLVNGDISNKEQLNCGTNESANSNKSTISSTDDSNEQANQNNNHLFNQQQHQPDEQSNYSSDFLADDGRVSLQQFHRSEFKTSQALTNHQFNDGANLNLDTTNTTDSMSKLMDNLLVSN